MSEGGFGQRDAGASQPRRLQPGDRRLGRAEIRPAAGVDDDVGGVEPGGEGTSEIDSSEAALAQAQAVQGAALQVGAVELARLEPPVAESVVSLRPLEPGGQFGRPGRERRRDGHETRLTVHRS